MRRIRIAASGPLLVLLSLALLHAASAARATCPPPEALTGQWVPELESVDTRVRDLMQGWDLPGGAIAVAKDGRLVYARGFGHADLDTCEPVAPDALFRIASVSKPITATTILKLVEAGLLDLDARVLPLIALGAPADPRMLDVTVRQLLWHAGGWDRALSGDPMGRARQAAEALGEPAPGGCSTIARYMLGFPLDFTPGTGYAYSNFGYCLLGQVIGAVTGESYEAYVRDQILAPLGIHRMQIGRTRPEQRLPGEVRYYDVLGAPLVPSVFPDVTDLVPAPYGGWYQEAHEAGGGWVGAAPDLLRFLLAADGSGPQPDLLQPGTLATMLAAPPPATDPDYPDSARPQGADPCATGSCSFHYGMGWDVLASGGQPLGWDHSGSLPGQSSFLVRMPAGSFNLPDASSVTLPSGVTVAALFNSNPNFDPYRTQYYAELLVTLVRAVGEVTTWPDHDFFACSDGVDQEGDGIADFPDDPGCSGPLDPSEREVGLPCDDGEDNDGDLAADVPADPGCTSPGDPSEKEQGLACDDGLDNDGDGFADLFSDPGCDSSADPSEKGSNFCDDDLDNDGDGDVDLADVGCRGPMDDEKDPFWPCDDGGDNEGDGLADYPADPGCDSPRDIDEYLHTACDDGLDDDGDGRADSPADPGCNSQSSVRENPQCQDGVDNDGQPGIDFDGGASLDRDHDGFVDAQFNAATPAVGAPDPDCAGKPWRNGERAGIRGGCGLGAELVLIAPLLARLAGRRRRPGHHEVRAA
jgi:N-acyl-D-amino-acid deacylase